MQHIKLIESCHNFSSLYHTRLKANAVLRFIEITAHKVQSSDELLCELHCM